MIARAVNTLLRRLLSRIVISLLRPEWVSFTHMEGPGGPELGLMVWGVVFALYKGRVYTPSVRQLTIRKPGKREYGESIHPVSPASIGYTDL